MKAIILDYGDGSINILPIPRNVPDNKECEYVESHPCYDSGAMAYMVVEDSAEVFEVSTEQFSHKENGIVCYKDIPIFTKVGEL